MGDRGNIVMENGKERVYLYAHWTGTELPEVLRRALERGKERWDDPPYLTRIIFCEMLKTSGKEALDELTGFGIWTAMQDFSHNNLVVDTAEKQVYAEEVKRDGKPGTKAGRTISFEKYVESEKPPEGWE